MMTQSSMGENAGKHIAILTNYGIVLKSGWGEEPTDEEEKSAMKDYRRLQNVCNRMQNLKRLLRSLYGRLYVLCSSTDHYQ